MNTILGPCEKGVLRSIVESAKQSKKNAKLEEI
jgi:hypothetical protein